MPKLPLPATINTMPAIIALSDAIGGTYANRAKTMGCSVGNLWKASSETPDRLISLESLCYYAQRSALSGGPAMSITVNPNGDLFWEIRKNGISKTGYSKGMKNEHIKPNEDHSNAYDHEVPRRGALPAHAGERAEDVQGEPDRNPFGP
jgi:hypothetical protein